MVLAKMIALNGFSIESNQRNACVIGNLGNWLWIQRKHAITYYKVWIE